MGSLKLEYNEEQYHEAHDVLIGVGGNADNADESKTKRRDTSRKIMISMTLVASCGEMKNIVVSGVALEITVIIPWKK